MSVDQPPARALRDPARLVELIRAAPTDDGATVAQSAAFVVAQRATLQRFPTLVELVDAPETAELQQHLLRIRRQVMATLWERQLFVGPAVLDDLLFAIARDADVADPVREAIERLHLAKVDRPGFVLFPLPPLRLHGGQASFALPSAGVVAGPTTDSVDATIAFLAAAGEALGCGKPVPGELVEHWGRQGIRWLVDNPLLAVRVAYVGTPFDAAYPMMTRLRAATSVLAMASALRMDPDDPPHDSPLERYRSAMDIDHWRIFETRHYFVFSDHSLREDALVGERLPIHAVDLLELSDLAIELDLARLSERRPQLAAIGAAVERAYRGYLTQLARPELDDARVRTWARMFEALTFYRRSFCGPLHGWSRTVSLGTAYELLLADGGDQGVTSLLRDRVGLLLHGRPHVSAHQRACVEVYESRCDLVHQGMRTDVDLLAAQRAFVDIFCELAERVDRVDPRSETPLRELTGDKPRGRRRQRR
jgi:hypothetical protein